MCIRDSALTKEFGDDVRGSEMESISEPLTSSPNSLVNAWTSNTLSFICVVTVPGVSVIEFA